MDISDRKRQANKLQGLSYPSRGALSFVSTPLWLVSNRGGNADSVTEMVTVLPFPLLRSSQSTFCVLGAASMRHRARHEHVFKGDLIVEYPRDTSGEVSTHKEHTLRYLPNSQVLNIGTRKSNG